MSQALHCPKCPFTPLRQEKLADGLYVDSCPSCHGRWYDAGELDHAVKEPEKLRAAMSGGALRPRPAKTRCPRCEGSLTNGGLGNEFLRVDQCAQHGFWLDAGELRLLEKLLAA